MVCAGGGASHGVLDAGETEALGPGARVAAGCSTAVGEGGLPL